MRAVARIDAGAVERNCARLGRELAPGVELCAVVKADGYGHGAERCARAALAGGAARLAVATAGEAVAIRDAFPGVPLLTMGALAEEEIEPALAAGSQIGIWEEGFRRAVSARATELGRPAEVHVKHDTGMGRLGEMDPRRSMELVRACAADPNLRLAGAWTHFATADEPDRSYFDEQLDRFERFAAEVRREHPGITIHAANSAAVLRERRAHFDMVRCGIAIYGLDPFQEDPAARDLEPALTLETRVACVKRFPAGTSAGYGRTWRAPRETWVGVLPIGYGDGVRRALSNNAEVLVGGRRYPLVGTVSMDNVTIDLGPEPDVACGEPALLIGAQGGERILAEEVAARIGTINYEVTCGISARVPRVGS